MKVYFMVLLVSTWFELIYIYLRKYGINDVFKEVTYGAVTLKESYSRVFRFKSFTYSGFSIINCSTRLTQVSMMS